MNDLIPAHIQDIEKRRIRAHMDLIQLEPIVHFKYKDYLGTHVQPVVTKESIITVAGPAKSRKSLLVDCLTSGAYTPYENHRINLGFTITLDDKKVIHIDTEQPEPITYENRLRFQKMCNIPLLDGENYLSYNLKPYSHRERMDQVNHLMDLYGQDVGILILDQAADFVSEYNSEPSVVVFLNRLAVWSDATKAIIILVIHNNRLGQTVRQGGQTNGVLGSYLEKKSDAIFMCNYDIITGMTTVIHKFSRLKPLPEITFMQDEKGLPKLLDVRSHNF